MSRWQLLISLGVSLEGGGVGGVSVHYSICRNFSAFFLGGSGPLNSPISMVAVVIQKTPFR